MCVPGPVRFCALHLGAWSRYPCQALPATPEAQVCRDVGHASGDRDRTSAISRNLPDTAEARQKRTQSASVIDLDHP
jgi:hypothetical protein